MLHLDTSIIIALNNSQERRNFLKEYHDFSQTQRLNDLRKTKSALPC